MKTYILTGDVIHAGRVEVKANSLTEAVEKAEAGSCELMEFDRHFLFDWNGDDDSVEEV